MKVKLKFGIKIMDILKYANRNLGFKVRFFPFYRILTYAFPFQLCKELDYMNLCKNLTQNEKYYHNKCHKSIT